MCPVNALDTSAVWADAVFVSGLQRCDEASADQVRQAITTAIWAFGCSGCAGRVAQEFGDHPETAVIRMRWARGLAREAFMGSPPEGGPSAGAGELLVIGPRLPAEQASGSASAERHEPARSAAGGTADEGTSGACSTGAARRCRAAKRLRARKRVDDGVE